MVSANQINLENVQKKFSSDQSLVLDNINLNIPFGEFLTILGPSGCGKSTLLRMIAGLETPTNGQVLVPINTNEMGFVFQEAHLLPWRNVFENVVLPQELKNNVNQLSVDEALKKFDILDAKNKYPHELSGGMKMRASLARALVNKPKLLLLDEPFSALDEIIRQKLCEELRSLWEREKITVVFVTHSLQEATFLSERVIVLSKKPGKIIFDEKLNLPQIRTKKLYSSLEFIELTEKIYNFMQGARYEK
ncbi:MAG: ABC transporter ATP-binding protein [Oligoflexia bacterium]|nr:ABC transporter ATP-binding protein [Oligoflexia bacterium]